MTKMSGKKVKLEAWQIVLIVIPLLIVVIISVIIALVIQSANLRIEVWNCITEYEEGLLSSSFTAEVEIAIYNHGVFSTTLRDASVKVWINGIYMGTMFFEEWEIIPPKTWVRWILYLPLTILSDEQKDSLGKANSYAVGVFLKGESSCSFYTKLIQSSHQSTF